MFNENLLLRSEGWLLCLAIIPHRVCVWNHEEPFLLLSLFHSLAFSLFSPSLSAYLFVSPPSPLPPLSVCLSLVLSLSFYVFKFSVSRCNQFHLLYINICTFLSVSSLPSFLEELHKHKMNENSGAVNATLQTTCGRR